MSVTAYSSAIEISPGFSYRIAETYDVDQAGNQLNLVGNKLFVYNYFSAPRVKEKLDFIRRAFVESQKDINLKDWNGSISYITLTFKPAMDRNEMIELLHHYILLEKLSKE